MTNRSYQPTHTIVKLKNNTGNMIQKASREEKQVIQKRLGVRMSSDFKDNTRNMKHCLQKFERSYF